MQIVPGQRVQLTYLVPNPADDTVYFPQAVVKNTQTGAILATVNLTQDATQHIRYTGSFVSPNDSIGLGYFMDSVCIPYTDSGHTTPSGLYGAALTEFFAYQLPSTFSGAGGSEIIFDYKKVADMFDEKFGAIQFPTQQNIEIPEFPEIPEYKETDLTPVFTLIRELAEQITNVKNSIASLPEPEKIDLMPVLSRMKDLQVGMSNSFSEHKKEMIERLDKSDADMDKRHKDHVKDMKKQVGDSLQEMGSNGIPITFMSYQKTGGDKPPSQSDIYNRLKARK